jgi:glycine/D-amino acid oxidase-like deaminating enzyme
MNQHTFHIAGAGFAGTALATSLALQGADVLVFDNASPFRASGAPAVLLTPITARQTRLLPDIEAQMIAAVSWLDRVHTFKPFYMTKGLLRPSINSYFHTFFESAFLNNHWPSGWAEWLTADEIAVKWPALAQTLGGIWFTNGRALDGSAFLTAAQEFAKDKGVRFIDQQFTKPEPDVQVVYTTGFSPDVWQKLTPLRLVPVKGQIDVLEVPFTLPVPITADGYAIYRDGLLFCGSTYEHALIDSGATAAASIQIRERLQPYFRHSLIAGNHVQSWTGVRVSTPDRQPIAGKVPGAKNEWIFTGLGSKGLILSAYLGQKMADLLLKGEPLPKQYSIERFSRRFTN